MTETRQQAGDETAPGSGPAGSRRYLLVFVAVVALYALGLNASWRFHRDSCLYMGLARSLVENGTYSFDGMPHGFVWPGFPAMLAAVYATVGENFLVMNLLLSLCGLGAIAVWAAICPHLPVTRKQAYICFLFFALSRTLYYYSSHVLSDVPFVLVALIGLWFGIRMLQDGPRALLWCAAASLAVCVACFLRPVGPCLLVALLGALWLRPGVRDRWRRRIVYSAVLLAPLLAGAGLWALRCVRATGSPGTRYVQVFIMRGGLGALCVRCFKNVGVTVANLADAMMGEDGGVPAGVILLVPVCVGAVVAWRRRERLLTIYGVLSVLANCVADPGRRYLLPALPVLFFWLVLGAGVLLKASSERFRFPSGRAAVVLPAVLVGLVLATNVMRIGKLVYQARSSDFYGVTKGPEMHDYFALADWLRDNGGAGDLVLAREDRFLHFFSRVRTVGTLGGYWLARGATYDSMVRTWPITLVVRDPEDPGLRPMDSLLASEHVALEPVASFGELRVFRLDRTKLRGGGG